MYFLRKRLVRLVDELRVDDRDHRMSVPQLALNEQKIAPRPQVGQVPIRMTQQLHARPIPETAGRENPHDSPIQTGSFVWSSMLVEHEGLAEVGRIDVRGQIIRPDLGRISADQAAGVFGEIDRAVIALACPHVESRLAVTGGSVAESKRAKLRVPQSREQERLDDHLIESYARLVFE